MKIEKFYLFLLACFVAIGAYSQDGQQKMTGDEKSQQQSDAKVKITGQVFDESGEGIPGANVTLKSNPTSGTVTDLDGKFILMASPQKDVLVVSFIGYNTQNHQQFQDYIVRDGVLALHPWGAYLQYVIHMMDNAAGSVLQSDFNTLLFISNNQNLTMSERGDVFAAIADLISKGHGKKEGYKPDQAVDFLQEAANCGNEFAKEQLGYE